MNTHPSVSIAIPTYNEEANIRRCLDSIFGQNYPGKLEVFIVDGGSKDKTIEYAKRYPVRILSNPYKQAEYGKKIGLLKSTGDYFMILDCDMDLVGAQWFEKMVEPLESDPSITGSWTKFVSKASDAPLNQYISLDPIQRDPLFSYLTPRIADCVVAKNKRFWTLVYGKNKLLPAGFNLFRRRQLLQTVIRKLRKFMELDNLVILLDLGYSRYAYVQGIGIHHPFLTTLGNLVRKRKRNLDTMYFNQPNKRYWTWIDWENPMHFVKLGFWVLYCYTILPSLIAGFIKSVRFRTWVGLYETPFNLVTTTTVIGVFIRQGLRRLVR